MENMEMGALPTTDMRHALLTLCLAWVGQEWMGETDPESQLALCKKAVRAVLVLPEEDGERLAIDLGQNRERYNNILGIFTEILTLGLHYENEGEPETDEARIASVSWSMFMAGIETPPRDGGNPHLDFMIAAMENWLTFTPGGLMEAVLALTTTLTIGDI